MKQFFTYVLYFVVILALSGCGQASPATAPHTAAPESKAVSADHQMTSAQNAATAASAGETASNKITVPLSKVVDGDTIKVKYNGKDEDVRFLLIDTPETHHPSKPVQPFGPEAETYVKQLLSGQTTVDLELGQGRDKYNRLLAYVYVAACPAEAESNKLCEASGKSVARMELAKGLARVAYIYEPNTKYVDEYRKLEAAAKAQKIGIWSIDNYVREDGYHPGVQPNKEQSRNAEPSSPAPAPKPPVQPAPSPNADDSSAATDTVYYKNCTVVKSAGKAPLYRGDPGYRAGLDRDNDGVACEK